MRKVKKVSEYIEDITNFNSNINRDVLDLQYSRFDILKYKSLVKFLSRKQYKFYDDSKFIVSYVNDEIYIIDKIRNTIRKKTILEYLTSSYPDKKSFIINHSYRVTKLLNEVYSSQVRSYFDSHLLNCMTFRFKVLSSTELEIITEGRVPSNASNFNKGQYKADYDIYELLDHISLSKSKCPIVIRLPKILTSLFSTFYVNNKCRSIKLYK